MLRRYGRAPKAIGERMYLVRRVMRLEQPAFARMIGRSQGTVSGIETGSRPPGLAMGMSLADTCGLTLDYIYRGHTGGLPIELEDHIQALLLAGGK